MGRLRRPRGPASVAFESTERVDEHLFAIPVHPGVQFAEAQRLLVQEHDDHRRPFVRDARERGARGQLAENTVHVSRHSPLLPGDVEVTAPLSRRWMLHSTDPSRRSIMSAIDVVGQYGAAMAAGDMEALAATFHPDAVWHQPGANQVSGDHVGPDAISSAAPGSLHAAERRHVRTRDPNRRPRAAASSRPRCASAPSARGTRISTSTGSTCSGSPTAGSPRSG